MIGLNNNDNMIWKVMWMTPMMCIWEYMNNVMLNNADKKNE